VAVLETYEEEIDMRRSWRRLVVVPVAVVLAVAGSGYLAWALLMTRAPVEPAHAALTVERLSEVSQLLTLRLDVSDVVITRIAGYTGGVQAAVLVKGDVSVGVDLSKARFEDADSIQRAATLILPPPAPSSPRVDHQRTRLVYLAKEGLWLITPGSPPYEAVVNKAMCEAQQLLNAAAEAKDADDRARHHAEAVLKAFCRSLSWEIQIRWTDRPTS